MASKNRVRLLAGAALAGISVVAAGCGGHGTTPPVPAPTLKPASTVKFTITVPLVGANAAARKPQFEAPSGTQSVSFQLSSVNGTPQTGTATVVNVNSSATGCTATSSTLTCTASVPGVDGSDVFTVTSYPQSDAKGTAIASGSVQVNTTAGTTTDAPVTLSGTIASISLSLQGIGPVGIGSTIPVLVIAKDGNGATIMGTYSNPITLADSDTSGATTLSKTSVPDSTTAVTLTYTGAALASGATISASASGVASSKITNVTFTPNSDYPVSNGNTMAYTIAATGTYTFGNGTPAPVQTASATETDVYTTGATFNGQSNLVKVNITHAAAPGVVLGSAARQASSTRSTQGFGLLNFFYPVQNEYFAFNPTTTGGTVNEVGWELVPDSTNNPGNEQASAVANDAGWEIAQLPFQKGNTWDAGSTYTETSTSNTTVGPNSLPGTSKDVYVYNKDGSYTDTYNVASNDGTYTQTSEVYTVNSDASTKDVWTDSNGVVNTETLGTPEPAPSGSGMTGMVLRDTYSYVDPSATPGPTPTPDVTFIPDWYPGGQAPKPLQTDSATDKGSVAIPQACNVPSTLAANAEQLSETYSDLDPWGNIYNYTRDAFYAQGIGMVCVLEHDASTSYYNGAQQDTFSADFVQTLTPQQALSGVRKLGMTKAASVNGIGLEVAAAQHFRSFIAQQRSNSHAALLAKRLKAKRY